MAGKKDDELESAPKGKRGERRPERLEDVETEPGAWGRFERAVDAALHTPPKQRPKRERGEAGAKKAPVRKDGG